MISSPTAELTIELSPSARVDLIDISKRIAEQYGDLLAPYPRVLYCSHHTTAGYLDQPFSARLNHDPEAVRSYLRAFQELFPAGASYRHDRLDERVELSEAERVNEPRNADSHLTFMSAGLQSCVAYTNTPDNPVYFVDLDGINGTMRRRRRSTVIGYHSAERIHRREFVVPVSHHAIDSLNLRSAQHGVVHAIEEEIDRLGFTHGWVELSLLPDERHAGLTVNEYETLLMRHDLVEVLRSPVRFMAEKGRNMLRDPRAIPQKAREYAKYDLVRAVNELVDALGLSESIIERIVDKALSVPASHFLRMKRSIRLPVAEVEGRGRLVQGRYQSPILVQWRRPESRARRLVATFVRLQ